MRKRLALLKVLVLASLFLLTFVAPGKTAGGVKHYNITVEEKRIEIRPGVFTTAWTYNGQIPGPLLKANLDDTVTVTLTNKTKLKHSIHVHGFKYDILSDGTAQSTNTAFPEDAPSLVPPGGSFTYTFKADRVGFYPYHCHSDDTYPVSVHIQMGLQGGILIEDPANPLPAAKEYMVLLNEAYEKPAQSVAHQCSYCAMAAKNFALNWRQWPLGQAYNIATGQNENPTARSGEDVRFYVLNLGNDLHTFHIHGHPLYERDMTAGNTTKEVPQDNKGFFVAEGAILETTARTPGNWLYHCHMDVHADLGMIGIFNVTP